MLRVFQSLVRGMGGSANTAVWCAVVWGCVVWCGGEWCGVGVYGVVWCGVEVSSVVWCMGVIYVLCSHHL